MEQIWCLCYLHDWDPPKDGVQPVYPQIHAYYSTWQDAEAVKKDMTNSEKYFVVSARPEREDRLRKVRTIIGSQT